MRSFSARTGAHVTFEFAGALKVVNDGTGPPSSVTSVTATDMVGGKLVVHFMSCTDTHIHPHSQVKSSLVSPLPLPPAKISIYHSVTLMLVVHT